MEGIIKVTPEKLINTAEEFNGVNSQIRNLTQQMVQTVDSLKSAWEGEAATAYSTQFHQLEDDIDRMYNMINEHVTDLKEMASQYQAAEQANAELGSSLPADAIS